MRSGTEPGRRSLARRFTLLVAAGVTGAVLAVTIASYVISRHTLLHDVDAALLSSARDVVSDPIPGGAFHGGDPNKPLRGGPDDLGGSLQFLDSSGQVRGSTPAEAGSATLPIDAADRRIAATGLGVAYRNVTINGQTTRLVTVGAGTTGAVQEARSLADVDATLRGFQLILLLTLAGGIVVAVGVGIAVSRAGLRPIRKISASARAVAKTEDLSALIPETGPQDIADIAVSMNTLLRALDLSRRRQRQLVDDASHELRTPLTSLQSNIELLVTLESHPNRKAVLSTAERAELLADLVDGLHELDDLVSRLTELARFGSTAPAKEDINIADLAEHVIVRAHLRGPRAEIVSTIQPNLRLTGNPESLERALMNLLDNALKFGPGTGRVTLSAGTDFIEVTDEGPGIDPADQQAIFGRFYRAASSNALPGSGLGLAMVAEAAREHGGWASVIPTTAGATLRLTLPGLHI